MPAIIFTTRREDTQYLKFEVWTTRSTQMLGCQTASTDSPVYHPAQTPGPGCGAYLLRHGATVIVLLAAACWRRRQAHLGPRHRSHAEALRASCRSKLWSKSKHPLENRRPSQTPEEIA